MRHPRLQWGDFSVDLESGELWRGPTLRQLTQKAAAVLRSLAARAGQVVSKEALFRTVWGETVVSDAALTVCIRELRQTLGDDARTPRFIETVHRRGYRFLPLLSAPPVQRSTFVGHSGLSPQDSALSHRGTGDGTRPIARVVREGAGRRAAARLCQRRGRDWQDGVDGSLPAEARGWRLETRPRPSSL